MGASQLNRQGSQPASPLPGRGRLPLVSLVGLPKTPGVDEATAVAVTRPDRMSSALLVLEGANPRRRLQAVLRPARVIRHQPEAAIPDREGLGVVVAHPPPPVHSARRPLQGT